MRSRIVRWSRGTCFSLVYRDLLSFRKTRFLTVKAIRNDIY
jgi:hypothetical protein